MPSQSYTYLGFQSDTAVDKQAPGFGRRATNVRVMPGYVVAAWGNVLKTVALPAGVNRAVDALDDRVGNAVVWLVHNSLGQHCIVRHDTLTGVGAVVLTWSGLRLPATRGRSHACTIDRFLLFIDGGGAVRNVNLVRAAAGEYTPALLAADPLALHLIKRPPTRRLALWLLEPHTSDPARVVVAVTGKAYQFAERWRYRDAEVTTLGPATGTAYCLAPVNTIEIVFSGRPPSALVESIDVCYRENDDLVWQVAATLRRGANGAFPDRYLFSGNTSVAALSTDAGSKTNEYLPPIVRALGLGQNRAFTGHAWEGFDQTTPVLQARAAAPPIPATGSQYAVVRTRAYAYTDAAGVSQPYTRATRLYYLLESGTYPNADSRYLLYGYDSLVFLPGALLPVYMNPVLDAVTVSYAEAFLSDATQTIFSITVLPLPPLPIGNTLLSSGPFLHERSQYQTAIEFYDALGRPMAATATQTIQVPARTAVTAPPQLVRWELPTTGGPALNLEIPPEADTYCLLLSRNQSASFMFQGRLADLLLYTGDNETGDAQLTDQIPVSSGGIFWLDINNLVAQGTSFSLNISNQLIARSTPNTGALGYVFEKGSGARVRLLDVGRDFEILYQRSGYLAISWPERGTDLGPSLTYAQVRYGRYEVFAPAVLTGNETLYQRSPPYEVLRTNAGTAQEQRGYAVKSGWLAGDTYLVERTFLIATAPLGPTGYVPPKSKIYRTPSGAAPQNIPSEAKVEAIAPTFVAPAQWMDARRGRPAFVIEGGAKRVERKSQVNFSNSLVAGTRLNGLSEWEASSVRDVPLEQGAVTGLRVAGQVREEGTVLVALQERGAESLYLGKVPLSSADGSTAVVALSDLVIGGSNPLAGGYGTRHPASIAGNNGDYLYFWDGDRMEPCRYARDGVTPLAETYGCADLFRALGRDYAGASVAGAYDPSTREYLLFFGPVGGLPGYTVAFSERTKTFTSDYANLLPDVAVGTAQYLYALKEGQLWRHEEAAPPATFFGLYAPPEIVLEADPAPGLGKGWVSVSMDADTPWGDVTLSTETNGLSRLLPAWFDRTEGLWQAPVHCDENTPGMPGITGLYQGRAMHSTTLRLAIRAVPTVAVPRPVLRSVLLTYDVLNDQLIGAR